MSIQTPKNISDPIHKMIDIKGVLPIVETPEFQALGYKSQLGVASLIYPSATHTRKAHSFGAYHSAKLLCRRLLNLRMISKEEADTVPVYGLIHDIGHYPISHVTEALFPISHDERGIKMVKHNLRKAIEECGVDFNLVLSLADHSNPLYLLVHDKNLGAEKLDYLERDGRATITDRPVGIDFLKEHIYWIDEQLAIYEKAIDASKDCQDFYAKMFKNVYLRRASVIGQRQLQKCTYLMLRSSEVSIEEVAEMYDFELFSRLRSSKNSTVRNLFEDFLKRNLFKEAVVLRYDDFVHAEAVKKSKKVIGLCKETMEKIAGSSNLSDRNQEALLEIESKVAKLVGLKPNDILVVTIVSPERFETQDIKIVNDAREISSLRQKYPSHFLDLAETAKSYTAFRICAKREHRAELYKHAEAIKETILEYAT